MAENFLTLELIERTALRQNPWTYSIPFKAKCPYGSEMSSSATHLPVIWTKQSGSIVPPENKETNDNKTENLISLINFIVKLFKLGIILTITNTIFIIVTKFSKLNYRQQVQSQRCSLQTTFSLGLKTIRCCSIQPVISIALPSTWRVITRLSTGIFL